jgi:CheY-like chemotaxis protein
VAEKQTRILVVDDREQNRYVLCRVLTQANYECQQASTGAEALALAATLPDIIILDVSLPYMSGFEVCSRIKGDPQLSQISILQISASMDSSEHKANALQAGADGYLIHPIDGTVLVATVRCACAQPRWLCANRRSSGRQPLMRSPKAWPSSAPDTA